VFCTFQNKKSRPRTVRKLQQNKKSPQKMEVTLNCSLTAVEGHFLKFLISNIFSVPHFLLYSFSACLRLTTDPKKHLFTSLILIWRITIVFDFVNTYRRIF